MSKEETRYFLRKINEDYPIGPLKNKELIELAFSARIAPEDFISIEGKEDWQLAPEYDFLQMVWKIPRDEDSFYGPTTVGTLHDFLVTGELDMDQEVEHIKTGKKKKISDLVKDHAQPNIQRVEKETMLVKLPTPPPEPPAPDPPTASEPKAATNSKPDNELEEVMETARELRIRQLEYDIHMTQDKYDDLLKKYRKLSEQMLQTKK
ncbi:MAG: hypothetical protein AAF984_00665 [Verrucomicrobiota bacterium]